MKQSNHRGVTLNIRNHMIDTNADFPVNVLVSNPPFCDLVALESTALISRRHDVVGVTFLIISLKIGSLVDVTFSFVAMIGWPGVPYLFTRFFHRISYLPMYLFIILSFTRCTFVGALVV